jgi:Tfp pilus assembly protein PilF
MAKAQELLQQGLEALEAQNRDKARDLLTQAMEEDPNNVEIWVALSKATDDVDEKRIALASILQLDPNNAYAKAELAKAEQEKVRSSDDAEIAPGITRRTARNTALGLTLYTVLVCGLAFTVQSSIVGGYNARQAQIAQEINNATAAALAITESWQTATQSAAETATQATAFAQELSLIHI